MKIGVIAQYLDTRNDIREVLQLLSQKNEVYLFLKKQDLEKNKLKELQVREIKAKKSNIKNTLLIRVFYLFGNLPKSRNNYFITELFKIANTRTKAIFKFEKKTLLLLSKYLPKFLSYDNFLDIIDYSDETKIDDIDIFLFFSEIYDDFLLAHLLNAGKKVMGYVYSWDHPCKIPKFSKRVHHYLVWNEGLKQDMVTLQNIPANKVSIIGASQLAYIKEFKTLLSSYEKTFAFDYIYFGCATGTSSLVRQEVMIIKQLAEILKNDFPTLKLVVRPYPFLTSWHLYEPLIDQENVVLDDSYRKSDKDIMLSREQIYDKFIKIHFAKAFIHLGTTMGFEATYFDTPVFQISYILDTHEKPNIYEFIHQYQNDKYLNLKEYPNIINSPEEWPAKIMSLLKDNTPFLVYNQDIARQTPFQTFNEFSAKLSTMLRV